MFCIKYSNFISRMICLASNTLFSFRESYVLHNILYCHSRMICSASNTIFSFREWYVLHQILYPGCDNGFSGIPSWSRGIQEFLAWVESFQEFPAWSQEFLAWGQEFPASAKRFALCKQCPAGHKRKTLTACWPQRGPRTSSHSTLYLTFFSILALFLQRHLP